MIERATFRSGDHIDPHDRGEPGPVKSALSPGTMRRADAGLAFALGLPRPS
jgi:hypothetical protein